MGELNYTKKLIYRKKIIRRNFIRILHKFKLMTRNGD